jgi:hypothetical protein
MILNPGAQMSGFGRPFRVSPNDEDVVSCRGVAVWRAATVIRCRPFRMLRSSQETSGTEENGRAASSLDQISTCLLPLRTLVPTTLSVKAGWIAAGVVWWRGLAANHWKRNLLPQIPIGWKHYHPVEGLHSGMPAEATLVSADLTITKRGLVLGRDAVKPAFSGELPSCAPAFIRADVDRHGQKRRARTLPPPRRSSGRTAPRNGSSVGRSTDPAVRIFE